jgi:hypothetical protein
MARNKEIKQMRFATEILSQRCTAIGCALPLMLALAVTGSAYPNNKTYTIKLGPPNGVDDTSTVQDALNNCAANHSSGCTIQFAAGTYVSKPLAVSNFHGALVGKGMDVTNIQVLTPLPDEWPTLLTFTDGDIAVSDMSFKVTAYQPVVPCDSTTDFCGVYQLVLVTGYTAANASFQRVAFEGAPGNGWGGYNLYGGVAFEGGDVSNPSLRGNFQMSGCRSQSSSEDLRVWQVTDAQITIGGAPQTGNTFEDAVIAVFIADTARSVVQFSNNTVVTAATYSSAVLLDQSTDYVHDPSIFNVQHNTVHASSDNNSGIEILDLTYTLGAKASTFVVSNNDVTLVNSPEGLPFDGIDVEFVENALLSNNHISGEGSYGIATWGANRCLLMLNDVRKFTADSADIGLLTDSWDTPNVPTTNCLVVLGSNKDTVENDGTGNIIIGGNNVHANAAGAAPRDAMKRRQAMLKGGRAFATAPAK